MRILYTLAWPLSYGGHLKSTLSLLAALKEKGHEIFLLAGHGPLLDEFKQAGIKVSFINRINSGIPMNVSLFFKTLTIIKRNNIDIVQAQDYRSLYTSFAAATVMKRPFFYTKAGGISPSYLIPKNTSIIVFSKELEFEMKEKGYTQQITCIPGRIDIDKYLPKKVNHAFIHEYGLPTHGYKVAMAMRLEKGKIPWLKGVFDSLQECKNRDVCFVLAGDGPVYQDLHSRANKINHTLGKKMLYLPGEICGQNDIIDLYQYADVVIGHGRGILEAMACGRPVVNVGTNGIGTLVNDETVEKISYYNFSGRHLIHFPELGSPIFDEVFKIRGDPILTNQLCEFSRRYVETHYAHKVGAKMLCDLYRSSFEKEADGSLIQLFLFLYKRAFNSVIARMMASISADKARK